MAHPWIPNSSKRNVDEMLKIIGVESPAELYSDIPASARMGAERWDSLPVGFGRELSELEVRRLMDSYFERIRSPAVPPFMGGGVWPHYIPEAVKYLITRGEMMTAYTPYQAEISQGLMQALFEYQSLIAELLQMEVVNSSMYDWSSALAEALLMAMRVTRRKKFVVPETMNPRHLKVVASYLSPHGAEIVKARVDSRTGYVELEDLASKASDAAAVYMEYPHFTGVIDENMEIIGDIAHKRGALYINGVEPISMAVLKPPGALGADIAVGEGQPLGIGLNYGGPYLGIFAIRWDKELVKQMPGRIVGMTESVDGERAFALILQTREQHIRRAKATSNITTNEALVAIAAAVYMSLLGGEGLRELAKQMWYRAHYAARRLSESGIIAPLLEGEFFFEFVARLRRDAEIALSSLRARDIYAGIPLRGHAWFSERDVLLTFTEVHSKEAIDSLARAMGEVA